MTSPGPDVTVPEEKPIERDEAVAVAVPYESAETREKETPTAATPSRVENDEGHNVQSVDDVNAASCRPPEGNDTAKRRDDQNPAQDDLETLAAAPSRDVYSVFSERDKRWIVFMVAFAGFFSPASTTIYFPALPALTEALNVSTDQINLTLTTFLVFQGLSPTVFGDLADTAGRRPAYIIGMIFYLAANVGLALQTSYPALLLLRCLQSAGSSATIALAAGVVSDISTSSERGTYMGWAFAGPLIGPAVAPVLGGILVEYLGWRSIFWFLTILTLVFFVPFLVVFPETGRNVVGDGAVPPRGWNMSVLNCLYTRKLQKDPLTHSIALEERRGARPSLAGKRALRFPNPLHALSIVVERDVSLILLVNALSYAAFYAVNTTTPPFFQDIYSLNTLQVGLCYIPLGLGSCSGSVLAGRLNDLSFARIARSLKPPIHPSRPLPSAENLRHFPIERARLRVGAPLLLLNSAAIVIYGWTLSPRTPLAVPLLLQFVVGLATSGAMNTLTILLVDLFPRAPATATAANNVVRCLVGAGATALVGPLVREVGGGWAFTLIGGVCGGASPFLWVLVRRGPGWREARRVRGEKREERRGHGPV
ncbi:MAG: hypothetical protein M1832_004541 [Thelocarpon impressellum]|nr:MAG: hypothetical protein M1832_004541 [Thelocarpon impressellum]